MTDWQKIIDQCNLFWQYPVSTEKQFYVQNNEVENYIKQNIDPDIEYYTCCQHIRFRELESILFNLNVKKLYTPHKCIGEGRLGDIELLACPLFAVNYEDSTRNSVFKEKDLIEMKRPLLFSFMGGLQPGYLTDIRERIFKMNKKQDVFIENTGGWHFNNIVYTNLQNFEQEENVSIEHKGGTQRYNEVMMNSRFSLCPSGTGPNSIRFWESLAIGTIPVLFSDTLELPHHELWENSIVRVEENKISDLYDILEKITPEEETELKKNCIRIYNFFRFNYRGEKI